MSKGCRPWGRLVLSEIYSSPSKCWSRGDVGDSDASPAHASSICPSNDFLSYRGSYFSSIPAASPTGDRHDDQADDGILSISCPEVSLGSLRSTGRARSPRQVRGRFRRQIHISKVKGMLRDSFAAPHGGGVASIVFERPSTAIAASPLPGSNIGASVIDLLANSKIRLDSVKRMTQILNTS